MLAVAGSGHYCCSLRVGALVGLAPRHMLQSCVAMLTLSSPRARLQCRPASALTGPSVRYHPQHRVANTAATLQRALLLRRSSGLTWTSAAASGPAAAAAAAVTPHPTGAAEAEAEAEGELKPPPTPPSSSSEQALAKARREARFDEEGEYRVFRELLEGKKTRYVSRVMYDGTNYKGFQLQHTGLPTVQRVLEKALSQRFQTYVPVVAAGRTDTGVHSVGQAVHFDLPNANEDLAQLTYSMNQMMPEDVRVWNMSVAPPSSPWQVEKGWPWSSMLNAHGKIYSYRLFVGQVPSPLDRLYRVHASQAAGSPIDVELLYKTIPKFVGEHDFAGFSNEVDKRATLKKEDGLGEFNTRRTVYSAEIVDEGGGNIRMEFHLDGALYRMVRNMVGTLLAVAAGRLEPEVVDDIFRTGVRDSCLIYAAPAHGLTLETVLYDGYS